MRHPQIPPLSVWCSLRVVMDYIAWSLVAAGEGRFPAGGRGVRGNGVGRHVREGALGKHGTAWGLCVHPSQVRLAGVGHEFGVPVMVLGPVSLFMV